MTKIMIVSETWTEEDYKEGRPFTGSSGFILKGMLSAAGINLSDCYLTSVFNIRASDVKTLCAGKAEAIPGYPALAKGKYVKMDYAPEVERLYQEIRNTNPSIIIALGPTAAWALCKSSGIKAIRGACAPTHPEVSASLGRPFKVLPTYHPTSVARDWTLRPVVITDLDKALRNSSDPSYTRPERHIWIRPNLNDLTVYEAKHMWKSSLVSIDIETKGDQITCIGFAPSTSSAIVIPFYDSTSPNGNYWSELADELTAWSFVRRWCTLPSLFQNGMYDIHFLWRRYGIPVPNAVHDTMLLHHAYQPEMEKGLGFLATVYTDEASWKFMRKTDTSRKGE